MTFKLNWQKRSVLILAAFVLIIGFILTVLAVRETERERLTRERELDNERQRYAALLAGESDSLFAQIEEKIKGATADSRTIEDRQSLLEACRQSVDNENLVADIFLTGANNDLVFPLRDPLFFTSERRRLAGINLAKLEGLGLFKTAESAELVTNNLSRAIQSYRALLNSVPDDPSRALVLNRLARCYLKSGNLNQALRTYNTILDTHSTELSSSGVPLGIIAFYQKEGIVQKTEPEKTGPILLEFYSRFVGSEWLLDNSQFQSYRNIIGEMGEIWREKNKEGEEYADFLNRWNELEKMAEVKFEELSEDDDFIEKIIPLVTARLFEFSSQSGEFSRFSEVIGDTLFLISGLKLQRDTVLGIRFDNAVLIQDRLPEILNRIPIPEDWAVQIADSSGLGVVGEKRPVSDTTGLFTPLSVGFNQNFPPWQILIFQRNPLYAQKQLNVRRNVYILIVVIVMSVLFIGGFLVIRSTAKELELARLKSEFVSTVSHEFRTPLMSIRYLSEMLDTGRVRGEDKKKIYYGKINKESERLSRLIENMLDFSKIEAGMKKYKFEKLSVQEVIADVAQRFKEYVADKTVTLECDVPKSIPEISADKEAISRALFNLLDNAVKYSGARPYIFLRAGLDGDSVFLEVEDRGAGMDKDDHKKVFEKFYRSSDPAHKNIEGSGIGLTLVEHIAQAHGGDVRLKSELGKGTRVSIFLPVSQKGKKNDKDLDRRG